MRYAIFVVLFLLLASSACFALSEQRRQCVQACCENYGGTYLVDSNGCENASQGGFECAMACTDPVEPKLCPLAILPLALIGITLLWRR